MSPPPTSTTGPVKRSVTIAGHSTSISLEPEFWDALRVIAEQENRSISALLRDIDAGRGEHGLSSAARLFALSYFRQLAGLSENTFS